MSMKPVASSSTNEVDAVDVTLLITFHREGIYAHLTLNSIERSRKYANRHGINTEYVWVLDCIDADTRRILLKHPAYRENTRIVEVTHADSGASRNSGIQVACGKAIALLDGDDYYSENWIERAWHYLSEYGKLVILHPEVIINFGAHTAYAWQIDQDGRYYNEDGLLMNNYWTVWTFAAREVYLANPYSTTRPQKTGFGYEDWHWNCQTIANGLSHRLAWGTVGFYRRKLKGSLVADTTALGALIPPTKLFDREFLLSGGKQ